MSDLPPEAYDDCFHPPSIPTQVFCLHCQEIYDSYLIEWREEKTPQGMRGFWRCPTPGCGGAGFGFDIHPIDPDYVDPDGRDMGMCCDDEEAWEEDDSALLDALDELDAMDVCDDADPDAENGVLTPGLESGDRDFLPPGSGVHVPEELEATAPEPESDHESPTVPMDDLLPENKAVSVDDLTPETMDEIERKIGWRDEASNAGQTAGRGSSSAADEGSGSSRRFPSSHDDPDWHDDEDAIPY